MTEFREQQMDGAVFARVSLKGARLRDVHLSDASLHDVDMTGADFRAVAFHGVRMRGVELVDVEISGEVENVVVNGVDIAPLVEAELDRRDPDREKMRPSDPDGFREAWTILDRRWDETITRARTFPAEALHEQVDGEWSFVQTLRHLNFASAGWVDRMVLGVEKPWDPLDLPWDEAPPGDWFQWDRDARHDLEDVLAVRRTRRATVQGVLDSLTDEQLSATVSATGDGHPPAGEEIPTAECLRVLLNEEWHHRLYAERDLTLIQDKEHH